MEQGFIAQEVVTACCQGGLARADSPALSLAPQHVLVLGIGNTLLRDDGVGVRVIERLREEVQTPGPVFVDGGTLSFSLLELVEAADALLVADAAELGEAPGTVRLYEGAAMDRFLRSPRHRSVHEVSLSDLLDMARISDGLPERRAILSIQPRTVAWGETLSATLDESLETACAHARAVLRRWGVT